MKLTRFEQETTINFNEGENSASIYTHNRALIRKLEKLASTRPKDIQRGQVCHDGQAVVFFVPKTWIKVYPPRQVSDERRKSSTDALKKARLTKKLLSTHSDSTLEPGCEGKDTTPAVRPQKTTAGGEKNEKSNYTAQ